MSASMPLLDFRSSKVNKTKLIGLIMGPLLFFILLVIPTPEGLPEKGKLVAGITLWIVIWWISEAINIYATSLLPLALFPITGVLSLRAVGAEYMSPIIILLLGMFLVVLALEKSGLQRKIAFAMTSIFGFSPKKIILGFMICTALISTVIMSTTVAILILPMAFAILSSLSDNGIKISTKFKVTLLLGIAFSSSIGSVTTLIASPPNLMYAEIVNDLFAKTITFSTWSAVGAPLALTMLLISILFFTGKVRKEQMDESLIRKIIAAEKEKIGKTTTEQKVSVTILLLVLFLMFAAPIWAGEDSYLETSVIAISGGISLFVIPKTQTEKFLNWSDVQKIPLGVLFILGAGLALSVAFTSSGLADYLGNKFSVVDDVLPFPIIVILIVSITMIIGNTMSNTATAAIFIPIVASMAGLNQWSPLPILAGITLSASLAFLLPMGTPPNALVYEKGKVEIKEMIKSGAVLTIIAIIVISLFTIFLYPLILPEVS
jgi:sodium-dependent dicarboxylate transporter 2/3/5